MNLSRPHHCRRAFTLIEIMVVVAMMAVIMGLAAPAVINALKKEGMRRALSDLTDACTAARSQAIMGGQVAELKFRPQERTFTGGKESYTLPDEIAVEMLDVNLREFKDEEDASVRFYPNGTCDEMTVVFRSNKNEYKKVSLEITTGLVTWGDLR